MPSDRLSERKKKILRAIVDDYIRFAEPVGSRSVSKRKELSLSSATIRNEMADLEEMGYLEQPHTSSGRIPSDKGYRFYVDELMEIKMPTLEEMESIKKALEVQISELNQLIKIASNVVSRITKYTSLVSAPVVSKETLKNIQLVPIETGKALFVGVTDNGIVKSTLIKIPSLITPDILFKISNFLNEKLSGHIIQNIDFDIIDNTEIEIDIARGILTPIIRGVIDCVRQMDESEVYFDGATNILNYPEFSDIVKAKEFLTLLDEKEILQKLLLNHDNSNTINLRIGSENNIEEIKDCTVVLAPYRIGNYVTGTLGVIGPTRMEYSKVISSVYFIKKKIDHEIKKLIGESFDDS